MTTHVSGDTAVLTGRSLRHITRSPDTIITTVITPIAIMLLFGAAAYAQRGAAPAVRHVLDRAVGLLCRAHHRAAALRHVVDRRIDIGAGLLVAAAGLLLCGAGE